MKIKIGLLCLSFSLATGIHAQQVLQEETTPPPAEGALTIPQIPPILSVGSSNPTEANTQQTTQPSQLLSTPTATQ